MRMSVGTTKMEESERERAKNGILILKVKLSINIYLLLFAVWQNCSVRGLGCVCVRVLNTDVDALFPCESFMKLYLFR